MKPNKKADDAAFIEKIKTINIGSGKSGPAQPPNCSDCGKPMTPVAVIPIMVSMHQALTPVRKLRRDADEQSFSA
jgi:hypothetical protein